MPADSGDGGNQLMAIEIEHIGLITTRDINFPAIIVGVDIIRAAISHDLGGIKDSIRSVDILCVSISSQEANVHDGEDNDGQ